MRCVGDDFEVRKFSTHTPVALGGVKIEKVLPNTTLSRTFVITLERAIEGEIAENYDLRKHHQGLLEIGRKLARWCADNRQALHECDPVMPANAFNRWADKWRPLFAIAQLAGGRWPKLVERAFFAEEREGTGKLSAALQLLADIREVLRPNEHAIATEELIDRLCGLDESPWGDYNFKQRDSDRRKIQSRQISNLLKDYRIKPTYVRVGAWHGRGYCRINLEPAWKRYLGGNLSMTPRQSSNDAASSDSLSVTQGSGVTDSDPLQATADAGCHAVTDKKGCMSDDDDDLGRLV